LTPEIFEALQILKGAYHNGHITAAAEAEAHMGSAVDELVSDLNEM
jgi:hypothetical protein